MRFNGGNELRFGREAVFHAEATEIVDHDPGDAGAALRQNIELGDGGFGYVATGSIAPRIMRIEENDAAGGAGMGKHLRQQCHGVALIHRHIAIFRQKSFRLRGERCVEFDRQDRFKDPRATRRRDAAERAGLDQTIGAHALGERADYPVFHQAVHIARRPVCESREVEQISGQSAGPSMAGIHPMCSTARAGVAPTLRVR